MCLLEDFKLYMWLTFKIKNCKVGAIFPLNITHLDFATFSYLKPLEWPATFLKDSK